MRALVTGASGFIGSHLVERLREEGHEVACLVRRPGWLEGTGGVELRFGDLRDPDSLRGAVRGVEVVYHLAGLKRAVRRADYYSVNLGGTERLLHLLRDQPLRRFVFVSSLAASGPSPDGRPRREEDPCRPVSDYGRSKLAAEEAVRRSGLPFVIVRPPVVYGPRDRDLLGFFRVVRRGWLPLWGRDPISVCFVGDLVEGLLRAASRPEAVGQTLFLADPRPYTVEEVGRAAASALGVRLRRLPLPRALLLGAGLVGELVNRLGWDTPLNLQKAREAIAGAWTCDVGRAEELLGFRARVDLQRGLGLTLRWYRTAGWL